MVNMVEQTVVDAIESCDADHDKAFNNGALRSTVKRLLVCIPDDLSGIINSFEDAIFQIAMASKSLEIIVSAVARETVAMTPIARYAAQFLI